MHNETASDPENACECAICSLRIDFEMDEHLLEEIEQGRCVIFAGAGVSTETDGAHSFSFFEQLAAKVDGEEPNDFCSLIDAFEDRPNGRQKLIEEIRSRFQYIDSWRELREAATRFHKSVATAPYFREIITTNWDRYFEDVISATPFVYDSDLAFWNSASRPVLKIHGSIDNLSSIVASSRDYLECEERLRSGRLGDLMRHLFATKTVLFVGYSAQDSDFLNIYRAVQGSMQQFARTHYLISPFIDEAKQAELLSDLNIVGIKTDATHFIETVKSHMRGRFCFAHDDAYDDVRAQLSVATTTHLEFVDGVSIAETPHLIFCIAYQDGLIHGLQRIADRRYTNEYANLHNVRRQIELYDDKISAYTKAKDYWNASYFVGYQLALIFYDVSNAVRDERCEVPEGYEELPLYYHPKLGCMSAQEYDIEVRPNPEVHKAAYKQALRFARLLGNAEGIVPQHTPFG
ncbi:MAG: SIR2 family protein [Erythrobacter sp.]|uniref:SIR2 family protein n=1 Tax=Erythrobacter sp. TaxID=1042 RepID=UPI00326317DF